MNLQLGNFETCGSNKESKPKLNGKKYYAFNLYFTIFKRKINLQV